MTGRGEDAVPVGVPAGFAVGHATVVEVAWRVLAGKGRDGRSFTVACRRVSGSPGVRAAARIAAEQAWNGELRLRIDGLPPVYTHHLEVAHWPEGDPAPRARRRTLWEADARRRAGRAGFLSRLRPVVDAASRDRVVHPRDARVLLALAAAACDGPITRPR